MVDANLARAREWLLSDQYSYGEWGRCESNDPTADLRDYSVSKIKPNLFISCQAALALESTGNEDRSSVVRFFDWLGKLRDSESGFWTSASGAQVPMGGFRGWSEVKNVRHTAKALDMYLLRGIFTPGDAPVLHQLLEFQANDGSFPQHPSGSSDLWSTAYARTCSSEQRIPITFQNRYRVVARKVIGRSNCAIVATRPVLGFVAKCRTIYGKCKGRIQSGSAKPF